MRRVALRRRYGHARSSRCEGCGSRTTVAGSFCRSCQSTLVQARKRVKREGLLVDTAGGSWWVWDPKGTVLVIGKPNKQEALLALMRGAPAGDES